MHFASRCCRRVLLPWLSILTAAMAILPAARAGTANHSYSNVSHDTAPSPTVTVPVANADTAVTHPGQKVRIPVLANDTNGPASDGITIVQTPQYGTAVPDTAGYVLYTPTTSGNPASDTFTYKVSNTGGASNAATVTVNFSSAFRLTNAGMTNVPAAPPATAVQVDPAFGSLAFSQPVGMVTPPGDTKRLFVLEKTGLLRVIPDVTAAAPTATTFLDLNVVQNIKNETLSTDSEQGLLGLAFHPNYATNGYFYVYYSGKVSNGTVYERIARFKVSAGDPNVADKTSEYDLISQLDEAGNHNAGGMAFGADGYLYVTIGDEGSGGDAFKNSQRIDKDFFSCFLRIDVDKKAGNLAPNANPNPAYYPTNPPADAVIRDAGVARYSIPADNPFVGATSFNGSAVNSSYVRTEFYAVGLRNPWRWSFDTASATPANPNGDLWCADVGQDAYEEVDIITKGGNYGWNYREAFHAYTGTPPAAATFIDPIYEYSHGSGALQGNSITGGFVYRGSRFASLYGKYLFADYVSGNIWSLARDGSGKANVVRIAGSAGVVAFAPDPSNGDVLMANINQGIIQRLSVGTKDTTYPATLGATNLFADLTDLSPNPGLVPYTPNLSFWSDYALKSRFVTIPDATSKLAYAREGAWTYPAGTVWVKHFDLDLTRGNDATKKRIETRVLVKTADNVYGVSYKWNDAGTEATLVDDAGQDFGVAINDGGTARTQAYHIPSRAECVTCHNAQAGGALSFNTRQLNHESVVPGFGGNFITRLAQGGYLSNTPESANVLPKHYGPADASASLEARVRSYLAVNCAYCHQPGGTAPTAWDGRAQVTLDATGLINGAATNNGGNAANKLVVPGDTLHSVVYNRVGASNGFTRMPPLGSTELDQTDISLLATWINQTLPGRQTYDQWRLAKFGSVTSAAGAPNADPDGDGHSNQEEFLAGTNPLSAGSFFAPTFGSSGSVVTLGVTVPANVSFQVEASGDLANWSLWDVAGNGGAPQPGGNVVTLSGSNGAARQFFRVRLTGN